jgi:hypothetical protein
VGRTPDFVGERLAHGALCHVCPLNGQRKVGHDGPPPEDAQFFAIAEAPDEGESEYGIARGAKYGRTLAGKKGYFWKVEQLATVGLARIEKRKDSRWPDVKGMDVHTMPVIMCRPTRDRIDSKEGKQAVRCCANSARWFINTYIYDGEERLPYEPEADIHKYVLRGRKPTEAWWPDFELWLKGFIKAQRKHDRAMVKQQAKADEARFLAENPWLVDWTKLYKKQLAAAKRAAKKQEVA